MTLSIITRRLRRDPAMLIGLGLLMLFVFLAVLAPVLSPHDPIEQHPIDSLNPPNTAYRLGADKLGRDMLSRMLYGSRISVFAGLAVIVASSTFGTVLGLIAGYLGGWVDEALMRVTDIFFAFPGLILAMAIAGALGPSLQNALIAVAVVTWPVYARLARGQTLALREREYVTAAVSLGVSNGRILLLHILPNALAPLLVQASFDMGSTILSIAGLSFIGFGAQPPTPEWGAMISEGRKYDLVVYWWLTAVPAVAILLYVAAFNLVGDGLRDALDPRATRS